MWVCALREHAYFGQGAGPGRVGDVSGLVRKCLRGYLEGRILTIYQHDIGDNGIKGGVKLVGMAYNGAKMLLRYAARQVDVIELILQVRVSSRACGRLCRDRLQRPAL